MPKKLILGFTAMLVAMTAAATGPARANDGQELGRILAGAAGLIIIGTVLSDLNDGKASASSQNQVNGRWRDRDRGRRWADKPGRRDAVAARSLPSACAFPYGRGRDRQLVYGRACLSEFAPRADRLPRACQLSVPVRYGRKATVYRAQCLYEFGYRPDSRPARRHD